MTIPIVCVAGPTGAGKTAASLALAQGLARALARDQACAVVNFDSRQVYVEFPIITAQPTAEERAVCGHRLYGFLPLTRSMAAGTYADLARQAALDLQGLGLTPIFVGGTGLYLKAMLEPLAPIPAIPEALRREIQEDCDRRGVLALHGELGRLDPTAAARIHPHDRQRVTRALEVYRHTNKPMSRWQAEHEGKSPYRALLMGLAPDPAGLGARLARRVDAMLAAGALDEARSARQTSDDPRAPGWSGIGCAELLAHLRGEIGLDQARDLWIRNTRAYAKRQMTWFRRQRAMVWFGPGQEQAMLEAALEFLDEPGEGA